MTREEYDELMDIGFIETATSYVDELEAEVKRLKDLRCNSVLISQEDVDFLQVQNQRYADMVADLEDEIERLNGISVQKK